VASWLVAKLPGGEMTGYHAPDRWLCIYTYLQKYLAVTKSLRGDEMKVLISLKKPYQAVSRDTIRRWIKQVLSNSGIDTNVFSAYSTRSASVSAANSTEPWSQKGITQDCTTWQLSLIYKTCQMVTPQ